MYVRPVKRISILALLAFLLPAAPSHAGDARLWACHGPTGQPLGMSDWMQVSASVDTMVSGGCNLPGSALTVHFTKDAPTGTATGAITVSPPPGVALREITLDRRATGPGYFARSSSRTLETASAGETLTGPVTFADTGSSFVSLGLKCDQPSPATSCSGYGDVMLEARSVALTVTDVEAPMFAVGGLRNPADGTLALDIRANDPGIGLRDATVFLDNAQVARAVFAGCDELSPSDTTADFALGDECMHVGQLLETVDTTAVANGRHELTVVVTDAVGNARSTPQFEFEIHNVVPTPTPTATPTPSPSPEATATAPATVLATPLATATPTPAPTSTPVAKPTTAALVRLPKRVSRKGVYSVSVLCPATSPKPCSHRLTLKAQGRTIATGKGSSKPGRRVQIALKLTSAARRTLARKGTLTATLTLNGAAPTTVRLHG
jgi:hypothetical protein